MLLVMLVLPVLVLEGPEVGLGSLILGKREFGSGEKHPFMRFFGNLRKINLGHVFGRD